MCKLQVGALASGGTTSVSFVGRDDLAMMVLHISGDECGEDDLKVLREYDTRAV